MIKRHSKPLGNLLDFKQSYFDANDEKLAEVRAIADVYRAQPKRTVCKNCLAPLDLSPDNVFSRFDVDYTICSRCGHLNGAHEDSKAFCDRLYTADAGKDYARGYTADDEAEFNKRVREVYQPKAEFLRDALAELGEDARDLADFGAGAGYFVAAADRAGFDVVGYEPSQTLVEFANAIIGAARLTRHGLDDTIGLAERCERSVASFIGVIEHLREPRRVLAALSANDRVRYVYFSVPLFSPTVVMETVFGNVMPRHLVAGHTHLYTEQSIQHFCDEFGFERAGEWWFGLDMTDLYRSVLIGLGQQDNATGPLCDYWQRRFMPLVEPLQGVLDEAHCCSEVHMLLRKAS